MRVRHGTETGRRGGARQTRRISRVSHPADAILTTRAVSRVLKPQIPSARQAMLETRGPSAGCTLADGSRTRLL